MDDIVLAAMKKWPDVPALFHWLSLDGRGCWRLRGEPISNPSLIDFICRNYSADDKGRWYFQNGPQRVYVSLDAAPWILRAHEGRLTTHTGIAVRALEFVMDEEGHLYALTDHGLGKIDDRDLIGLSNGMTEAPSGALAMDFAARAWDLRLVTKESLPKMFGFDADPDAEIRANQPRP